MEKSDEERQGTEPDDSHDAQIAKEKVEDEPQKQQASESQMEDDQSVREMSEGTGKETSKGLTGSANYELGQIIQPKLEQREESVENVSEELSGSTGMEHERVVDECQKEGIIQAPTEVTDDAAAEISKPSETTNCRLTIGNIVRKLMKEMPAGGTTKSLGHEELAAWMERDQNVPKSERPVVVEREFEQAEQPEQELLVQEAQQVVELVHEEAVICDAKQERLEEATEQPEQELLVQEAQQVVELVLEEAVIYDARQERMEEADDIEEPQKYAFRGKKVD